MIFFNSNYANLPEAFYQNVEPSVSINPKIITINKKLAKFLNIDIKNKKLNTQIFSGKLISNGSKPIAMAYAGHQFGNFVPMLGDGRAILLGEIKGKDNLFYDIHLKGSGKTRFSRNGDGRCPLGPAVREYLLSEAINNLNIPTTRSLAILSTGENIMREHITPGAILVRVASSHVRVGTFEYFSFKKDYKNLKILADFCIGRHFPNLVKKKDKYLLFFFEVLKKQIKLVSKWLSIGFIHGVMNTDNTSIFGETIDYGPCAFMDCFKKKRVFSSIDYMGRYSYGNQSSICLWNMVCLANAILPLFKDQKSTAKILETELQQFDKNFDKQWVSDMSLKFGSKKKKVFKKEFINSWLDILEVENIDYTNSFLKLENLLKQKKNNESWNKNSKVENFLEKMTNILKEHSINYDTVLKTMRENNPYYIPRNHLVDKAIKDILNGDFKIFQELLKILKNPFREKTGCELYQKEPKKNEIIESTFCGT